MEATLKLLLIFLFFMSCSSDSKHLESVSSPIHKAIEESSVMEKSSSPDEEVNPKEIERKLIKTGSVSFETDDLSATRKYIEQAVEKYNGYISTDNQYKSHNNITSNLTVRIPSKKFDAFLSDISSKVDKFDSKDISVKDITEQFLDIQVRLKVKKALEERYKDLLKKTNSVKEILEVEKELTIVRADIESMEGRLKYLQNQVSFSTLNIRFYKVEISQPSSKSFWRRLANAFTNGIDNIKWFFIGLVNIWPFIIISTLAFILIKKRIKNRKK